MEGYFTLTLDTTGPNITVYSPQYSDRTHTNEIRFISNETLMDYQDIYIIDSQGTRHDEVFSFNGIDEYIGNVVFTDYPMGIASIYGQFKDDVGNLSNIAISQINVISTFDSLVLKISMLEQEADVLLSEYEKAVNIDEKESIVSVVEKLDSLNIKVTEQESSVKLTEKEASVKLTES